MPTPNGRLRELSPVISGTEALRTPAVVGFSESKAATALGGKTEGGSNSGVPLGSW